MIVLALCATLIATFTMAAISILVNIDVERNTTTGRIF